MNIDITGLLNKLNELERMLVGIQKNNWDRERNAYFLPLSRMNELSEKLSDLKKLVN